MDICSVSHQTSTVFNVVNAIKQDFSLPSSIVYFMIKYPSTWKVYFKLIKSCKYFYSKNDAIPVNGIFKGRNDKPWIVNAFGRLYSHKIFERIKKYWICGGIFLGNVEQRISKNIIKKIYRCDITQLVIDTHALTFEEFYILASSKKLEFFSVSIPIRYDNDEIVTFGTIIKHLPNAKYIQYEDPDATASPESIIKIIEQLNGKFEGYSRWFQLGPPFYDYSKYLKESTKSEYAFCFSNAFLDINAKEFHVANITKPEYFWKNINGNRSLIKSRKETVETLLLLNYYIEKLTKEKEAEENK